MSSGEAETRKMKTLTIRELDKVMGEVMNNESYNVDIDSEVKLFFGDPNDGKELRLAAAGIGNTDQSDLVLILEPRGSNRSRMIDELIDMLEGLRSGDNEECPCPLCVENRKKSNSD